MLERFLCCEFATVGRDGTPAAWPVVALYRPPGSVLSTSIGFPVKAANIRRDPRVSLLFSVRYVRTRERVLEGLHVLATERLPLPTDVSSWDPSMTRIDGHLVRRVRREPVPGPGARLRLPPGAGPQRPGRGDHRAKSARRMIVSGGGGSWGGSPTGGSSGLG